MMCCGQGQIYSKYTLSEWERKPKEEPTSWKRKAKGLAKMREKQKDQAKGEDLSQAEWFCLDERQKM